MESVERNLLTASKGGRNRRLTSRDIRINSENEIVLTHKSFIFQAGRDKMHRYFWGHCAPKKEGQE